MGVAHRQVASMRRRSSRAPLVMPAAVCRTRWRNEVISQRAKSGVSVNPMSLAQTTRCGQDDFEPGGVGVEAVAGRLARPAALASRIRSSTRACWRWRSSKRRAGRGSQVGLPSPSTCTTTWSAPTSSQKLPPQLPRRRQMAGTDPFLGASPCRLVAGYRLGVLAGAAVAEGVNLLAAAPPLPTVPPLPPALPTPPVPPPAPPAPPRTPSAPATPLPVPANVLTTPPPPVPLKAPLGTED